MTRWCAKQVSGNCRSDPISGKSQDKCVRMKQENTSEGKRCSEWINSMSDGNKQNYKDAVASTYCSNYNTPECLCVNRGISYEYQGTKNSAPYNDGCWFRPCTGQYPFYFIPSDVNTKLNNGNPGMCPQNVCLSFVSAKGYNYQSYQKNKLYVDC